MLRHFARFLGRLFMSMATLDLLQSDRFHAQSQQCQSLWWKGQSHPSLCWNASRVVVQSLLACPQVSKSGLVSFSSACTQFICIPFFDACVGGTISSYLRFVAVQLCAYRMVSLEHPLSFQCLASFPPFVFEVLVFLSSSWLSVRSRTSTPLLFLTAYTFALLSARLDCAYFFKVIGWHNYCSLVHGEKREGSWRNETQTSSLSYIRVQAVNTPGRVENHEDQRKRHKFGL